MPHIQGPSYLRPALACPRSKLPFRASTNPSVASILNPVGTGQYCSDKYVSSSTPTSVLNLNFSIDAPNTKLISPTEKNDKTVYGVRPSATPAGIKS